MGEGVVWIASPAYFLVEPSYTDCWSAPLSSGHSQALADLSYENWISTDPAYVDLAQEILSNGGDIAHVLQSLQQTVMAANTYYDQLPQFNDKSSVI